MAIRGLPMLIEGSKINDGLLVHRIDDDTIIFQTFAPYTDHGQIIIIHRDEDAGVEFIDISRNISGTCHCDFIPETLYKAYLNNHYGNRLYDWATEMQLREVAKTNQWYVAIQGCHYKFEWER